MRVVIAVACLLFSFSTYGQELGLKKIPSFEFNGLDGKKVEVDQLIKDKELTIISFWATWCKPCLQEMEAINDVYEEWQEQFDLQYLAVSTDNSRQANKVKALSRAKGWEFQVVLDQEQKGKQLLNFANVPYLFVVNQSGEILYAHSGYLPGFEEELEEKLTSLTQ